MVLRHRAVLEHDLAVVHEAAAEGLVAARHREARRVARHQEARRSLGHAGARLGGGVYHVELRVPGIGDELLAAVDHPLVALQFRPGVHHRFRHVVGQPAVGGAARLGQAMRQQEGRVLHHLREPSFLQVAWRDVAKQHRDLPDLHHFLRQAAVATGDFLGDHGEGLRLGLGVERRAAELLRDAERADADVVGDFQDLARQARIGIHVPFRLPVLARERNHVLVRELAGDVPHHAGILGQPAVYHFIQQHAFVPG